MGTVDKIGKELSSPAGMGIAGTILGGPILGSALYSSGAASEAADLQSDAANRALELQATQFEASKELLSPYATGGVSAFEKQQALSGALGPEAQAAAYQEYQESPGVAFQREQGTKAATQAAAASGNLGGGSRLKAISEFNQGLALQDFQNQFNQLGAVSQTGLGAAGALSGAGQQFAAGQSQTLQQGAAAQAQGTIGQAQAFQSGVSDFASLAGFAYGGGFGGK